MALMGIFTVGNILSFIAKNFTFLVISRMITALVSGVTISIALSFVGYISPMAKKRLAAVMGIFRFQHCLSTWGAIGNLDFNQFWLADFVFNDYRDFTDHNGFDFGRATA
ncbi:hypothetical protein JCM14108_1001 [Lentilactobacillus farraginis DSM 18382 = JCM 14108]|uniref:Uncharacterized protein n=1 Tax=Lentilactobacillus farraginis DSM 18382 = JCM 14108 TaxID=1423743 RepID=X0QBT4_9LACO|nr:hypothetical protein JCM14108_1001 [Lentilactobacillus farraginis DSM 18382 = JCM 14108]